jgi:hypothetical protein
MKRTTIVDEREVISTPASGTERSLDPSNIRVFSTDFDRTFSLYKAIGRFLEGCEESISIDLRNGSWMMPDSMRLFAKTRVSSEGNERRRRPSIIF